MYRSTIYANKTIIEPVAKTEANHKWQDVRFGDLKPHLTEATIVAISVVRIIATRDVVQEDATKPERK